MSDEELRALERDGANSLRFLAALDRHLGSPPLTEEVEREVARFQVQLQKRAWPLTESLARTLAALDDLPEEEGVRWKWIEGVLEGKRRLVALVVVEADAVAISALPLKRNELAAFVVSWTPDDEGSDGGVRASLLTASSPPAAYVAWARARERLRVHRTLAERWARRHLFQVSGRPRR